MRLSFVAGLLLVSAACVPHGTFGAECEESCSTEFPRCVNFKGCEECLVELETEGSRLVNQGGCTVGCDPTRTMEDLCPGTPSAPTTTAPTPSSPAPTTGGGPTPEKPDRPVPCTSENQGDCRCPGGGVETYVLWPSSADIQRCLHVYVPPNASPSNPVPVLISVSGYGTHNMPSTSGIVRAAEYYGYAALSIGATGQADGAGGFGLEFPNGGVANPDRPKSCEAGDSRDHAYVEAVLDFVAESPDLDATGVYLEGFSQNSMFAAYVAVCWADRVAGLWQGGSGLAKTSHTPIVPGKQAQCSFDSYDAHGNNCCTVDFCTECTWWPLYPRTCEDRVVDCLAAYTNDNIACGSDWYMYEAMVAEGNDARLLSFPPPSEGGGGHKNPKNTYSWITGCLGIVDSCSPECEASFSTCISESTESSTIDAFAACESDIGNGLLSYCNPGCAPTLDMLAMSETPVATLSEGRFGTSEGVLPAHSGSAPRPACDKEFGHFDEVSHNTCNPPAGEGPATGDMEECDAVGPATPAPSLRPTSSPTVDTCKSWCYTNTSPWMDVEKTTNQKCNWSLNCAGCPECENCKRWCLRNTRSWDDKCNWDVCQCPDFCPTGGN